MKRLGIANAMGSPADCLQLKLRRIVYNIDTPDACVGEFHFGAVGAVSFPTALFLSLKGFKNGFFLFRR